MPKHNKDTINQHGYVYSLHHKSKDLGNNFYIGSTVNWYQRKRCHKDDCSKSNRKQYNFKVYKFIRENDGFASWEMDIIEKFVNISSRELERIEQKWRDELKPNLNSYKCTDFSSLHNEDKKKYDQQYQKKYYDDNMDDKKKYNKKYRQENIDHIHEHDRERYQTVRNLRMIKNICACGGNYTNANKCKHFKTKKHQNYISQSINIDEKIQNA